MKIIWWIGLSVVGFWVLGGQLKGRLRDIPVPILMGIGIWLTTKSWLVGLISIGFWQVIRLGYGNYEEGEKNCFLANLTKDRKGWYVRAIYGLIVALMGVLPLFLWHKIALAITLAYIAGNALIGFLVSSLRLSVLLTDILVSAGFASLIFLPV